MLGQELSVQVAVGSQAKMAVLSNADVSNHVFCCLVQSAVV